VLTDGLRAQVQAWIAADPDDRDRAELAALLAADSEQAAAELADRFSGRLEFGTAGLRGVVAAGPNRMNRAVVRATSAAVAQWLRHGGQRAADAGVVIGCDARHRSADFTQEAALVLAGAGITVHLLPARQPTPLLAFAVRHLGAAAGIMITASHNPAADNGYKLYLSDGAQIIPPADAEIELLIGQLGPLAAVRLAQPGSPLLRQLGDEIAAAYLDAICALSPAAADAAWLRFVYTPLHGVAGSLALRAFERAGYPAPDVVEAQAEPDPAFPTVAYPNPEVPGALDLALTQARRSGADLVIANDPDGDRMAVAVPAPGGGWRTLTGDQVGALLGSYLLGKFPAAGDSRPDDRLVVSTIVSGSLLTRIAADAGAQHIQTLTGFKWIVRAGDARPELRFLYGYEEALGYCVGDVVRDKDGISAALTLLGLAAAARSAGGSLLDAYDALERAHGVHLTAQVTTPSSTPVHVMAGLRASTPAELAGEPVLSVTDLTGGTSQLPSADVLTYRLPDARVVIRPSGTEPKIKAYLEVVQHVRDGDLAAARERAAGRMARLIPAVDAVLGGREDV
jgi:phosphomannomutase